MTYSEFVDLIEEFKKKDSNFKYVADYKLTNTLRYIDGETHDIYLNMPVNEYFNETVDLYKFATRYSSNPMQILTLVYAVYTIAALFDSLAKQCKTKDSTKGFNRNNQTLYANWVNLFMFPERFNTNPLGVFCFAFASPTDRHNQFVTFFVDIDLKNCDFNNFGFKDSILKRTRLLIYIAQAGEKDSKIKDNIPVDNLTSLQKLIEYIK